MATSIFEGKVFHARVKGLSSPVEHAFSYPVWMALVDLDQVENNPETLPKSILCSFSQGDSQWSLTRWRRSDHFGSNPDLSKDVRRLVERRTGILDIARVELLTNLSFFGVFNFNPVSVYYCYDTAESLVSAVLEVSNTPWLDKRLYVLKFDPSVDNGYRVCWEKDFHVSPFMDQSHFYDWNINPLHENGNRLLIDAVSKRKDTTKPLVAWEGPHVNGDNPIILVEKPSLVENNETTFVVKLDMKRVAWEKAWRTVLFNPIMPLAAILWIHVEAFKVWYKGCAYVNPPMHSRILDLKDLLIHLVVFAVAAFVKYGIIMPFQTIKRLITLIQNTTSVQSQHE